MLAIAVADQPPVRTTPRVAFGVTTTDHSQIRLDMEGDTQSEMTQLTIIIIIPACVSIVLVTIVLVVFLCVRRRKFSPLIWSSCTSGKLPPPYSSGCGSNVKLWLSKQQVKSPDVSRSRHSWPAVLVSSSSNDDPDKLSVVSQNALYRVDFQRRFEDGILSRECRLYPKPVTSDSVRSDLDSFPTGTAAVP